LDSFRKIPPKLDEAIPNEQVGVSLDTEKEENIVIQTQENRNQVAKTTPQTKDAMTEERQNYKKKEKTTEKTGKSGNTNKDNRKTKGSKASKDNKDNRKTKGNKASKDNKDSKGKNEALDKGSGGRNDGKRIRKEKKDENFVDISDIDFEALANYDN